MQSDRRSRGGIGALRVWRSPWSSASWFDAFHARDLSRLILAEDFVHSSPFGEIKGREAYLNMVRENPEAFFRPTVEIVDVLDSGDKFAVRYLVNGNPACDCIYAEAQELISTDPMTKAGRLVFELHAWMVPKGVLP